MPEQKRTSDPVPLPGPAEAAIDRMTLASILLSPVAVGINVVVGFTVAHWAIAVNRKTGNYAVTAVDLLLCVLSAALAAMAQRRLRDLDASAETQRREFMVKLGLILSAFSVIVIVASTIAVVTLSPSD